MFIAEFLGICIAFCVASWARFRFKSSSAKWAFFLIAAMAGFLSAMASGIAFVLIASGADSESVREPARALGGKLTEMLGAATAGSIMGLVSELGAKVGAHFNRSK